jgi:hypothetical protein
MKSIVFCTSFASNRTAWESRYKLWFDYYSNQDLGADWLLAIDDASPFIPHPAEIKTLDADAILSPQEPFKGILQFPDRLGRSSLTAYPGWWRSFLHSVNVARMVKADKIIHIESDAFIFSDRLFQQIRDQESGWSCLWSPHFRLPETAIQVICHDQFHKIEALQQCKQSDLDGHFAENILPFTHIDKSLIGDRYGEIRKNRCIFRSKKFNKLPIFDSDFFWSSIPANADFATQVDERLLKRSKDMAIIITRSGSSY